MGHHVLSWMIFDIWFCYCLFHCIFLSKFSCWGLLHFLYVYCGNK